LYANVFVIWYGVGTNEDIEVYPSLWLSSTPWGNWKPNAIESDSSGYWLL